MSDEAEPEVPDEVAAEIDRLLDADLPIRAVQRLREVTGLGLAESKAYVSARRVPIARPTAPCPYCGKALRTEKARQCLECGMDWHDPHNVRRLGPG